MTAVSPAGRAFLADLIAARAGRLGCLEPAFINLDPPWDYRIAQALMIGKTEAIIEQIAGGESTDQALYRAGLEAIREAQAHATGWLQ
jgi:hypothetical protein